MSTETPPSDTPPVTDAAPAAAPAPASAPAPAPTPAPAQQGVDPRRRLRELQAISDRDRTDAQWDELNELEIQFAPGNRATPGPAGPVGVPRPFGQQKKHPPKGDKSGGSGGGKSGKNRPRPHKQQGQQGQGGQGGQG